MTRTPRCWLLPLFGLVSTIPAVAADVTLELDSGSGFVIQNNGASVERLRVDEATGNISRNGALFVHTTGSESTFLGEGAGNVSPSTVRNAGFGYHALAGQASSAAARDTSAFGAFALASTTGCCNSAFGSASLVSNTTGQLNNAFGFQALLFNTTGGWNDAFGGHSLKDNETGSFNSAFGYSALGSNTTGNRNSAFGEGALLSNQVSYNSAFGAEALENNFSGSGDAFGFRALRSNNTGTNNAAFGSTALTQNSTGQHNVAFGAAALSANTTGSRNSALGVQALSFNVTGADNVALGDEALFLSTGARNVAVGKDAGRNLSSGNDNIYLANTGTASESGRIKIGNSNHVATYLEGIDGVTLGAGSAVYIDSNNQLGSGVSSSLRTKTDVVDMGHASDVIGELRPVLYRYRAAVVGESEAEVVRYGLIAEEVAEVAPQLVTYDDEGKPSSVQYRLLTPLLLNELQKQERRADAQDRRIAVLEERLEALGREASPDP